MILPSASLVSWLLVTATAVAYAIPAISSPGGNEKNGRALLLAAWVLHAACIAWSLFGDVPRFGFAPALSMTAWLVLTVYSVESHLFPRLRARWMLSALGAVAVLLALFFPGQPLHVSASAWLPLHLALGIASYGLFAAAVVHAWLMGRAESSMRNVSDPDDGIPLLTLERLTFRFVSAGFVLLTATLLAGWLFGEVLYGNAWQWGHKTVFSVLAWLTFAILLVGRSRFGWRGRYAAQMVYLGAALLLLAYVGSRFVLEVILGRTT